MRHASEKIRLERRAARAFGLKDYDGAIRALEDLLDVVGENPNTLHVLATCRQRKGEHGLAIAAAERGLSADPKHLSCLRILAEAHAARDELDSARGYAARALALFDARPQAPATLLDRLRVYIDPRRRGLGLTPQERDWIRWARALCQGNEDLNQ